MITILNFNEWKNNLSDSRKEKYKQDAATNRYLKNLNNNKNIEGQDIVYSTKIDGFDYVLSKDEFYNNFTIEENGGCSNDDYLDTLNEDIAKYREKMTENDFDAEGFIPKYIDYLNTFARKQNKTVLLRWINDFERDYLENMPKGQSLSELGSYWTSNDINTFRYADDKKYLHFFYAEDYEDRGLFMHNIDREDDPKVSLIFCLVESKLIEKGKAKAIYETKDSIDRERKKEVVILSQDLYSDNIVSVVDREKTCTANYSQKQHEEDMLNVSYPKEDREEISDNFEPQEDDEMYRE